MANVFLFLGLASFTAVMAVCPNGWFRFTDSCYHMNGNLFEDWPHAMNTCLSLGAHLVKIESMDENEFLKTELRRWNPVPEVQFWTAGNDRNTEGDWNWAPDGERFEITDWYPGEPNNYTYGDEDCVSFYTRFNLQWNDEACFKQFPYLCEIEDPVDTGLVG